MGGGGNGSKQMSGLEVTFLGTGTSVGVPMIGCDCEVCTSEDPRDKRTRSSIYVETPELKFIVDTGPDLRVQCLREGVKELDAVLYTHAHMDHIVGFDDLRRFSLGREATLDIFARPAVLADLRRMFDYAFNGENKYPGYIKPVAHAVAGPFALGATLVTPLPVVHGKLETVGYLFSREGQKRFAYIPDCKALSETAKAAVEGVGTLVVDALRHTEHFTHQNFEEALATAAEARAGRTYFIHMADEILHARDDAALPDGVSLSYDGLRITC